MKMAVIGGAGLLGSTSAFLAGMKGYLEEIKLIDIKENLVKNHVLDMGQAVYGSSKTKISYGEYEDLSDCGIILLTASMPERKVADRMEYLWDNMKLILPICEKIKANCKEAVLINATNPVDIFNYIIWKKLGWKREKVLGFNGNDTYRLKWAVSSVTGKEFSKINGFSIGEHGNGQINLYDKMTYLNKPLNLSEVEIKQVEDITSNFFVKFSALDCGRTSGWCSAVNIEELIEAVATNSGKVLECSSVLDGEYGLSGISLGMPVVVGNSGIKGYTDLELTAEQKDRLEQVAEGMKEVLKKCNIDF
ncbi:L-lactate dehydrogenase [Clostridiales bacterium]|nr:L-lactate dehydrogenase [Clostridiales bacterium]